MIAVTLRPGKEKSLLRRHPWVYDTAVAGVDAAPDPGETVRVVSHDGRFLGYGAYSPDSTLRVRMWAFSEDEEVDRPEFLRRRLSAAIAARQPLRGRGDALRLVYAEADGLPGLIVDAYGPWLVTQFQSALAWRRRDEIVAALMELTGARGVWDRSDAAVRAREGLPPRTGSLAGTEPPPLIEITEDGIRYLVDVRRGHKTGFYLDQRDSRRAARRLAEDLAARQGRPPRALNCFCYSGGFSLALAAAGADPVIGVDSSAEALALARRNAALNGYPEGRLEWWEDDVFAALRRCREEGRGFDLIVLDPPKFAASRFHVERACRAYKDINLNALRLLAPGGLLLTFSCSGAVSPELFRKVIAGAVIDSGREAWIRDSLGAGEDHPLLVTHPEGEYLKGLILELR